MITIPCAKEVLASLRKSPRKYRVSSRNCLAGIVNGLTTGAHDVPDALDGLTQLLLGFPLQRKVVRVGRLHSAPSYWVRREQIIGSLSRRRLGVLYRRWTKITLETVLFPNGWRNAPSWARGA